MASVVTERGGRRLIQLSPSEHPQRPKIRLGKVTKREAASALVHVENLCRAKRTGAGFPPATADWLADLPVRLRGRLEQFGLVEPQVRRECPTLAEWVRRYIEGRSDVKDATATVYGHTRRNLLAFFGKDRRLDEITPGDADAFRVHLKTHEGLADNTVRRRLGIAKQFFRAAVRLRLIGDNPFDGQSTLVRENPKRLYFISHEETQAVLDACPDAEWRLIFGLCRYGGLRCPTEVLRLRWGDVDWDRMRFTVHASKTEHHADGGVRQTPIFPELAPLLQEAFDRAEPGTEHVITRYRNTNANLRTQLTRIIKGAGLTPWPKLFQNLRSTRETELTQQFPVHVVCKWIGNSPQVANRHYLQVTEEHFAQAVQNPVQHSAELSRPKSRDAQAGAREPAICGTMREEATPCETANLQPLGVAGLEPAAFSL